MPENRYFGIDAYLFKIEAFLKFGIVIWVYLGVSCLAHGGHCFLIVRCIVPLRTGDD